MDKILIGSMVRSGSTWTFNAVRLMAELRYGHHRVIASDWKHFEPVEGTVCELKKAHDPIPFEQLEGHKVITTVRDFRDAFCSAVASGLMEVASYSRRGLVEGVHAGINLLLIDPSYYWRQLAGVCINYEEMIVNKVGTLKALHASLWGDRTPDDAAFQKIALLLEYLPALESECTPDRGYLFGRPHIQGVGIGGHLQFLPFNDVLALNARYAEWLEDFGYPQDVSLTGQT